MCVRENLSPDLLLKCPSAVVRSKQEPGPESVCCSVLACCPRASTGGGKLEPGARGSGSDVGCAYLGQCVSTGPMPTPNLSLSFHLHVFSLSYVPLIHFFLSFKRLICTCKAEWRRQAERAKELSSVDSPTEALRDRLVSQCGRGSGTRAVASCCPGHTNNRQLDRQQSRPCPSGPLGWRPSVSQR